MTKKATPPTVSYTALVNPGVGSFSNQLDNITGWTPATPFTLPAVGSSGTQSKAANDLSPITIIVTANNSAKGASVILIKNSINQQSIGITGIPAVKTFAPLTIVNGDVVELKNNP